MRVGALALGVFAVLAACAGRLMSVGGVDAAVLLLLVSLFSVAAGGVYQQKFCSGVDFRATQHCRTPRASPRSSCWPR